LRVKACIKLYAKELKIDKNDFTLIVFSSKDLVQEQGANGMATPITDKLYAMHLSSRIDSEKLIEVIAHEMVHIKQFAKGQLKRIGRQTFWMGKRYVRSKVNYYDHPWEHDAWSKEKFLSAKIFKILSKENEKFERSQRKS
jgi:hypothetical protein